MINEQSAGNLINQQGQSAIQVLSPMKLLESLKHPNAQCE